DGDRSADVRAAIVAARSEHDVAAGREGRSRNDGLRTRAEGDPVEIGAGDVQAHTSWGEPLSRAELRTGPDADRLGDADPAFIQAHEARRPCQTNRADLVVATGEL